MFIRIASITALTLALAGAARAEEIAVETWAAQVAADRGAVLTLDEGLKGKKIAGIDRGLPFDMALKVAESYGVEFIDDEAGGKRLLHVVMQRNAMTLVLQPRILKDGEPIPDGNWLVQKTYHVRYADPNAVQTAIRATKTRDPRRMGDIISVSRSDAIIITDLSTSMEVFETIIADLDRPVPAAARLNNMRLDIEVWSGVAAPAALLDKPEAAYAAIAKLEGVTRVAALSTAAAPGAKGSGLDCSVSDHRGEGLDIVLHGKREIEDGQLAATIDMKIALGKTTVEIAPRSVHLRPGEWMLLHAATPGVAVFVRGREE